MKTVNTFPDAQVAIRDIYNQLDLLRSKNWDRHQLRIVNAHPSVELYDYVVRKELLDSIKSPVVNAIVEAGFKGITWNIGCGSGQVVGANVASTPPLPYGGSCIRLRVNQKTWDSGSGNTAFDILRSSDNGSTWNGLLLTDIIITEGDTDSKVYTGVFNLMPLVKGDLVRFDVTDGIAHDLGVVLEIG